MKRNGIFLAIACAVSASAQADAQDVYVSAVIGGASIAGLVLMVGAYRLVIAAVRKVRKAVDDQSPMVRRPPVMVTSKPSGQVAPALVIELPEACWAAALSEFESTARRAGLWAKVYADAGGDDGAAKAEYLRMRAHEIHLSQEVEKQSQRRDVERLHAASAFARLKDGKFSRNQTIGICEAQLRALGFEVERPTPDKWEVRRNTGSSFVYTVEDLQKLASAYSAEDLRKRAVEQESDAA